MHAQEEGGPGSVANGTIAGAWQAHEHKPDRHTGSLLQQIALPSCLPQQSHLPCTGFYNPTWSTVVRYVCLMPVAPESRSRQQGI